MKFYIYSRKSVCTGKGESVENQIDMCREYIQSKYPQTPDDEITVYEDEGFSAKNTERPQFQRMLRDLRLQKPDFIVCYRLDRISRNVGDFSSLIEELNDRGISFVCIKEEFDTSKPMGKAMMYIASVFAQLERETIAERVRDNMLMLARTGRWLGGTTPTGYTSRKLEEATLEGKIKTSYQLKENSEELETVGLIYGKYLELRSISGVGKELAGLGIKSRDGKGYSLPGIKQILQNPVYCIADQAVLDYFSDFGAEVCADESDCRDEAGLLAYNKRDYRKKGALRQSADKWILAVGRHKGCIPSEKWIAVQRLIQASSPNLQPVKPHNDYALLSGRLFCSLCGSQMVAKRRSGKHANPALFDYVCGSKLRRGLEACRCPNLGGIEADRIVCEQLLGVLDEVPVAERQLTQMKAALHGQLRERKTAQLQERISDCQSETDRLISSIAQGRLEEAFVRQVSLRVTELDREAKALQQELEKIYSASLPETDQNSTLEAAVKIYSSAKSLFEEMTLQEKRTLLNLLIQKMVWNGSDLDLTFFHK